MGVIMSAPIRIFVVFLRAYFLSYFFRAANAVISPDLKQDLGLGDAQLGLMTSLFYLSFALAQLPLGGLLDRYGPRFVHPAMMLVGVVGALLFASAQGFAQLSLGRALLGIGMGAALMGTLKAFSLWFPPERYASMSSQFVGLGALGGLMAATPLAWLESQLGWRGVFSWGSLVILVVAATVALFVRNTPPGVAWPVPRSGQPSTPPWQDGRLWRIGWLNFNLNGALQAWQTLWGGAYLYQRGLAPLEVGNLLLAFSLGALLGFLLCGPLGTRFGLARVTVGAGLVLGLCALLLAVANPPTAALWVLYPIMGFVGGFNILSLVQARLITPPERTGRAVTFINFLGFIGVFLLQWLMGLGIQWAGYPPTLAVLALLLASAVYLYWPMLRLERR